MTINGDYPTPILVNGYPCRNCAQVAEAKKDINPAKADSGIGGASDSANTQTQSAVQFGGALSGLNTQDPSASASDMPAPANQPGTQLDLTA